LKNKNLPWFRQIGLPISADVVAQPGLSASSYMKISGERLRIVEKWVDDGFMPRRFAESTAHRAIGVDMNKDQMAGRAKEVAGKVKGATGSVTNRPGTEVKGKIEEAAGKAQAAHGDAKEHAKSSPKKHH
jgi:uncharacterized protein YjbJ (UPF0337 family)